jgi:hypothetical protein
MLAHLLVVKYCDHLPLYRQAEIYAREGLELDRSTLCDWVGHAQADLRTYLSEATRVERHSALGACRDGTFWEEGARMHSQVLGCAGRRMTWDHPGAASSPPRVARPQLDGR